eukprot:Gb_07524 [translate_table: standard]
MGGGAILRTVGRVMGAGGGVGSILEPSVTSATQQTSAAAKSSWSVPKVRAKAGICEQGRGQTVMPTLYNMDQRYCEIDDWELVGDANGFEPQHAYDRLVFGSAPTRKEVEEATSDLQAAVRQASIPSSGFCDHETASSPSSSVQKKCDSVEDSNTLESENKSRESSVDWMEPELYNGNHEVMQNPRHNNVFEAFHLLQQSPAVQVSSFCISMEHGTKPVSHGLRDPVKGSFQVTPMVLFPRIPSQRSVDQKGIISSDFETKGMLHRNASNAMVISLASDEAIWEAILKNDKIKEFRQSLLKGESKLSEIIKDSDKPAHQEENSFIQVIENTKVKVKEYMEKITELVNNLFGLTDTKIFEEKAGDLLGRTLKMSLMLSIAVLLVVLVNRGQKN